MDRLWNTVEHWATYPMFNLLRKFLQGSMIFILEGVISIPVEMFSIPTGARCIPAPAYQ